MTEARASEIERKVFYRHMEALKCELERCDDSHLVFNVGRRIGLMQKDLRQELNVEVTKEKADEE